MFFRIVLLAATFTGFAIAANAQNGCTDPIAINYNAAATLNDGSCVYAPTHYDPQLRAAFGTGVAESSGLIFTDGKLWTHNDSGNPAEIYSIDTTTGAILQTVVIDNYPNTDWEDIAADSAYIYVGDFGNNNGDRTDLKILKVAKADITAASTVHVAAQAISFSYTDQTSFTSSSTHNFDCEAMIAIGDSLYLFTKDRGDLQTRVYRLPKVVGTYARSPYTSYNINGLITGADYNPATKEIVLLGYFLAVDSKAFLWFLYDYKGDRFFSGNKRRIEISNGGPWQTEGITYMPNNRFAVSCESLALTPSGFYMGERTLGQHVGVTNVDHLPAFTLYPNPTTGILHADDIDVACSYALYDATGRHVMNGMLKKGTNSIDVKQLMPGEYLMTVNGKKYAKMIKVYK